MPPRGGTNLGLQQSYSVGETSLREGVIITIIITNDPLIGRGSISINIFTSTISSEYPSSSLVSNLVSKPQIGTCGLLGNVAEIQNFPTCHQDPLTERGSISINIFTSTISSQNPSSSLVSNLVSKPQIGTCGLLVVLITPCS